VFDHIHCVSDKMVEHRYGDELSNGRAYPEFRVIAIVPGGGVLILRLSFSPSSPTFCFDLNNPSLALAFPRDNPPSDGVLW